MVMLTSVTFFLLSCYSAVLCYPHGAINCCPKHSTRRWFGGPNRELLYRNGVSSYPSKYTSRLADGGFYLTIHNVEVKDLNVSYACSVAIYEYTNILLPRYDIVLPETSMSTKLSVSTKLSMSTKPSICGNIAIGWDDKIPYMIIIPVIMMGLILVGGIAYYHRSRIKKLLMGKFCSNNASTTLENGKGNINMESGKLIEDQAKTENSDQKSFQEGLQEDKVNIKRHCDELDMGLMQINIDKHKKNIILTRSSTIHTSYH